MTRTRNVASGGTMVAPATTTEPAAAATPDNAPAPGDPGVVGMAPEGADPDRLERAKLAFMGLSPTPEGAAEGADAPGGEAKDTAPAKPDDAGAAAADDAAAKLVSPELAKIKEREREATDRIRERERALATRESQVDAAVEAKVKEAAAAMRAELLRQATRDPVAFYRELGLEKNFSSVGELLFYADMDEPPEGMAKKRRELEIDDRIARLEAREKAIEEREKQEQAAREQEQLVENYTATIRDALGKVPAKMKHVAHFAKERPDAVIGSLLAIARKHAQTTGEALAPGALIEKLEEDLKRQALLYQPFFEAKPPKPAPPRTPAPSSIDTATHASRVRAEQLSREERLQRATSVLERGGPLDD